MRRRGLFITIDGPSGVGKTTTASLLVERLRADGVPTHATKEPSTSEIGQLAYKHVDTLRGHALACLFAADRYHHATANIRPRLAAGESVVQDRYLASSLVMQRLDGVDLDWLASLNRRVEQPNLSVILTADPRIIGQRLTGRGTHNRYQDAPGSTWREWRLFTEAADHLEHGGLRVLRIDTTGRTPADIAAAIADELQSRLQTTTTDQEAL